MAGHWIIADRRKELHLQNTLCHKKWGNNTIIGAETITLLELFEVLWRKGKHINRGKIEIGFDNKKAYKEIKTTLRKYTKYAQDAGAEITRIKEIMQELKFDVEIKLITRYKKEKITFEEKPLKYLLSKCDAEASKMRKQIQEKSNATNIKHVGKCALKVAGNITTNSIQETIRIVDGIRNEREQLKSKLKHHYDLIDLDARNAFPAKKVTASVIKCSSGYNHYGVRHAMINKEDMEEKFPRCNEIETWEHVMMCKGTEHMRKTFVEDLVKEMLENKEKEVNVNEMFGIIEDILRYLEKEQEEEYETNQAIIGMQHLFRGYAIKAWTGVNFDQTKYHSLNKILIKHCVLYYTKCWKHRNEIYHDEEKQRERALKWKEELENM